MEAEKSPQETQSSEPVRRIAIFDDSMTAMEIYKNDVFKGRNVQILFFPSSTLPPADLSRLEEFDPDLFVVDLVMESSRLDGFILLKKLRENDHFKEKPIAVCSKLISDTFAGEQVRKQVKAIGVEAALAKIPRYPTYEEIMESALAPSNTE